jgi:multiple sugar transport system permease protein
MKTPVTAHSVAEPSRWSKTTASFIVATYGIITILPLLWIFLTGFKTPPDSIAYPPKILFEPSVEGYVNLFTTRSRQTPEFLASLPPPQTWYERLVRSRNMVIGGPSKVVPRFLNSMVIGFGSTFLAVCFGTIAAYAFSRFRVPLADDLLFFILSTRMMPPIAVAIPIYLMFRYLGLTDTKLGMILLYTAVNVSLAVWLLKGFMDEIPREYEEAAMIDGYTRLQAFFKVVLPQATTGIAATAIFCLIFAWNEYAFAVLLTSGEAQTMPPFIPFIIGGRSRDDVVLRPDPVLHHPAAPPLVARHHFWGRAQMTQRIARYASRWPLWLRRGPCEAVAMALIGLGVLMLMQPLSLNLYSYSFVTILAGTLGFVIVSHFPD